MESGMKGVEETPPSPGPKVVSYNLEAKWGGKSFNLLMDEHRTIGDVKKSLSELTDVLSDKMKIVGLWKGKKNDSDLLSTLNLKREGINKFMMIGTPEKSKFIDASNLSSEELPDVINDLIDEWIDSSPAGSDLINLSKLEKRIQSCDIRIINAPREGKKLLVLDLDYTLFDMKSPAEHISELKRPFLNEFMTACYAHYDIVVWSQTSWKWLEMKLTELGLLTHSDFKICFVLDRSSMFPIETKDSKGEPWRHEVKPLAFIWKKLPQYGPKNTIHIDDLGRNFAMNPQSGLKITAFKNAHTAKATDRELYYLAKYLVQIALNEPDFSTLKHKKWKKKIL